MPRFIAPDRPDWRWVRVAELSQYSTTAATARLRDEDEITRRAYAYRCALDRNFGDKDPAFHRAHQLFMGNKHLRLHVEGLILGGADNDLICDAAFLGDPEVVELYHETFFWVRPALNKPLWINAVVLDGMAQMNTHPGDITGCIYRLAWKLGHQTFYQLLQQGICPETTLVQLKRMTVEVLTTQLATLSFSAGVGRELPEWAGGLLNAKDDMQKAGNTSDFEKSLDAFFEGLSIAVADPTDNRNLTLPAREARVADYEVVQHA